MKKTASNAARMALFSPPTIAVIMSFSVMVLAYADHHENTSTWQTDMTFSIKPSLNDISHASFTPATDFEDAAGVWNDVPASWWDLTRDDINGDIGISARSFGWLSADLARTTHVANGGIMTFAAVEFNTDKDFRDVTISQGWWSYDYKTVAIHEIGHVAGIHNHTDTAGSPMRGHIEANLVDRTPSSHDIETIGGMY